MIMTGPRSIGKTFMDAICAAIRKQPRRKYTVHCTCRIRYKLNNDEGGMDVKDVNGIMRPVCCHASCEV